MDKFNNGDSVRADDGKEGVVTAVRYRSGGTTYLVKWSPLYTAKEYWDFELELVKRAEEFE